jgi:hypothetical protein
MRNCADLRRGFVQIDWENLTDLDGMTTRLFLDIANGAPDILLGEVGTRRSQLNEIQSVSQILRPEIINLHECKRYPDSPYVLYKQVDKLLDPNAVVA